MYQLLKNHEDKTEQVEFIASYKPQHVLETAVEWHKSNVFGWEIRHGNNKVAWCTPDGSVGFELPVRSTVSPAQWMRYYLK